MQTSFFLLQRLDFGGSWIPSSPFNQRSSPCVRSERKNRNIDNGRTIWSFQLRGFGLTSSENVMTQRGTNNSVWLFSNFEASSSQLMLVVISYFRHNVLLLYNKLQKPNFYQVYFTTSIRMQCQVGQTFIAKQKNFRTMKYIVTTFDSLQISSFAPD